MRPTLSFMRRMNLRNWAERRLRTSLTVLGVAIGVALVVAVSVVNSALLTTVRDTATRLGGSADLEVAGPDRTGLTDDAVFLIYGMEGVKEAVPVLRAYTEIEGPQGTRRTLMLGATPELMTLFPGEEVEIRGMIESHKGLLLSEDTAEAVGAELGNELLMDVPEGREPIEMSGRFSGDAVDQLGAGDVGVMPLPAAQEVFGREGRVDSIYVTAEDGADVERLRADIEATLQPGAIVGDPGQRAGGFEDALNGISTLTALAGTVALFVAAFVVFNTVSMSIGERRREISLSLALGATRRQVVFGFVGEALVLGSIASALGLAGGFLLAKELVQPGLEGLRVFSITAVGDPTLELSQVLLGALGGLAIAGLASYLPARRIMKVAPVESLRLQGSVDHGSSEFGITRGQKVSFVAGLVVLVGTVAGGFLQGSELDNAAWTTSIVLVLLLVGMTLTLPVIVPTILRLVGMLLPIRVPVTTRLALESLQRKPRRTTVTVAALVFTLGIVVGVGGALDSYSSQWMRSATDWHGGPIHVVPQSFVTTGADQPFPERFGGELEAVDGVAAVYPARYRIVYVDGRQVTLYIGSYAEGSRDPAVRASGGQEFRDWVGGILDRGEVVVSAKTAEIRGVSVGDSVFLPTPSGEASFRVGGIMQDLNPLDSMFLSTESFLRYWGDHRVDTFSVSPTEGSSVPEVIVGIERLIRERGIPAEVMTKDDFIARTFAPIDQIFSVARAVQLAALIVAALAIANTMFISVLERRWELGLQKAVGMDGRSILRMLLVEAGVIGLVGSLLAWFVGIGMGYLMVGDMKRSYSFSFPFEIPVGLMLLTLVLGSVVALLAGVYPSRRALRTPIVESLRFE